MAETENRPKQGGRAPDGKFASGASGNPRGRPADYGEFRKLCRSKSPEAVDALVAALGEGGAPAVAAARVLLEYGWGKPSSAPEDLEALEKATQTLPLSRAELLAVARIQLTEEES